MLTTTAVSAFLLSRNGLRPKTQEWYARILRMFQRRFQGDLPEAPQPIQEWLGSFSHADPETVHAYFKVLRAIYRQMAQWHPDMANPMPLVRAPRVRAKAMRTFSPAELWAIFQQPLPPRDRGLLTLFLDNGVRVGEAASLTFGNIRPGYAVVTGKGGHEREVPISPATERLLLSLMPADNHRDGWERQPVFVGRVGRGRPLTTQGLYKIVRRWCRRAKLTGRRLSPHTFRHTFGTTYAENEKCNPKELQKIMGHQDFKTTLRYIQGTRRSMMANHQACSPLRAFEAMAQGQLFGEPRVLHEAEEIVRSLGGEHGQDTRVPQ
ncbi:MAG: site-specific integrase [Chloroflexota bacterium]|nr:site-specific integrase [Chloroflexota bacterium]